MGNKRAMLEAETAIARLALRQHGVISLTQLGAAGLERSVVTRRTQTGRLHRLHRGVYSIVPPRLLKVEGRWLAAVLACGKGSVLSHTAAAALWDLRGIPSGPVHVTVPTPNGRRPRRGIRIHRSSTLLPSQTTIRREIPATKPSRTLADLRRVLDAGGFAAVLRKAEILRLDVGPQPEHVPDPERSELERRFQALCRSHSLPLPRAQQIVGPYTVDFLWPGRRLVVEVDGWGTHGTRTAFEADRARDAWLNGQGFRVVRFTWRQIQTEPETVVHVLRELLARNASTP